MNYHRRVVAILCLSLLYSAVAFADLLPAPSGQTSIFFTTGVTPMNDIDPAKAAPIGIGPLATGGNTLSLSVSLNEFEVPVDLFLALGIPGSDSIIIMDDNNMPRDISEGLVPWAGNVRHALTETVFSNIPTDSIPTGTYRLYLLAVPTGEIPLEANCILWTSTFVNQVSNAGGYAYKFFGHYNIKESNDLLCSNCATTLIKNVNLRIEGGFDILNNEVIGTGSIWVAHHDPCSIKSHGTGGCCLSCVVDNSSVGTFTIDGVMTGVTSVTGYGFQPTVSISFTEDTPVSLTGTITATNPATGAIYTAPLYHTNHFTQLLGASGFYGARFNLPTVVCDGFMSDLLVSQISETFTGQITPIPQRHYDGSGSLFFYESPFHIDGDQ